MERSATLHYPPPHGGDPTYLGGSSGCCFPAVNELCRAIGQSDEHEGSSTDPTGHGVDDPQTEHRRNGRIHCIAARLKGREAVGHTRRAKDNHAWNAQPHGGDGNIHRTAAIALPWAGAMTVHDTQRVSACLKRHLIHLACAYWLNA